MATIKPRSLKVLYTLLLLQLENKNFEFHYDKTGLCKEIIVLNHFGTITDEEEYKLFCHLELCKPSKNKRFSSFMKRPEYTGNTSVYWFKIMDEEQKTYKLELI